MECLLETKADTIVEFIQGLHGTLSLTFEEGTSAACLHDLLKPYVRRRVVCDPRKAALLKEGNKSDRIDAQKLAELLRTHQLKPVYHEEHGIRALKELGRSYLTLTKDVTRGMNRIKARYRGWGIACSGSSVYAPRHRAEWLAQLVEPGVRVRAKRLYQQLDGLQPLRLEARRELLQESHKHPAVKLLRQIPSIGPIRAALLVALLQTPHRFRTKRQLWAYSGFAVETHDSGEYRWVRGKLQRNRERITVRGLNDNHKCRHLCQHTSWSPARLLYGWGGQGDAADDGASDPGTQDRHHHLNDVEERNGFRSTKLPSASSLNSSGEAGFPLWDSLRWWQVGFWRCSVREEYQSMRSAPCASAPSHPLHVMPSYSDPERQC
jgi:Transposase IS116/IS110/IS902 family/Transposase